MPAHLGYSTQTTVHIWAYFTAKMEQSPAHKIAFSASKPKLDEALAQQLICDDFIETENFWDRLLQKEDNGNRDAPKKERCETSKMHKTKDFWKRLLGRNKKNQAK